MVFPLPSPNRSEPPQSKLWGAQQVTIVLAAVEALLLAAALTAGGITPFWIALHIILVSGTAALVALRATPGDDVSQHLLAAFATMVAGVFGALLAAAAIAVARTAKPDARLLEAWYDRIAAAGDVDRVTRFATAVAVGRGVLTDTDLTRDFERVIADGSTADRQNALGLIARQFVPAYAGALKSALVSSEPVIRVQAAAVAVKVKGDLASILALLVDTSAPCDALNAAEAAATLKSIRATGLLDGEEEARAASAAEAFTRIAMEGFTPEAFVAASSGAREVVETELLRARRFSEFRAIRVAWARPPATEPPPAGVNMADA